MINSDLKKIRRLIDKDKEFGHFSVRLEKELTKNSKDFLRAHILFKTNLYNQLIGFCVLSYSKNKMVKWEKAFKEEGWVSKDFVIEKEAVELMYMYIKPDSRNKGYGSQLLAEAFSYARKQGLRAIYAYVSDKDGKALGFYKKTNALLICEFTEKDATSAFLKWSV